MGHYDGPVFLRRQQTMATAKKKVHNAQNAVPEPVKHRVRSSTRHSQPLVRQRHFTPKHIPKSVQQNQRTDEEIRLARYVQQLKKAKTSFLLFASQAPANTSSANSAATNLNFLPADAVSEAEVQTTETVNEDFASLPKNNQVPTASVAAVPESSASNVAMTHVTSKAKTATSLPKTATSHATAQPLSSAAHTGSVSQANSANTSAMSQVIAGSQSSTAGNSVGSTAVSSQPKSLSAASSSAVQSNHATSMREPAHSAQAIAESSIAARADSAAERSQSVVASQSQTASTVPTWQTVVAAVKANAPQVDSVSQSLASAEVPAPKTVVQTTPKASEDSAKASLTLKKQVPLDDQHYQMPPLSLLPNPVKNNDEVMTGWVAKQRQVLDETLKAFNVHASVTRWSIGPAVTQFEVSLARGVKVSKITNLSDDLKLALAAKDIRIEAPIPGKTTVGIEIPNLKSRPVMLSEVVKSTQFQESQSPLTVALGVDLFGQPMITNVAKMPHGLIAGATSSGKSVFINSLLLSILFKAKPTEVKLLLIDPKAVELAPYNGLPHLLSPVISDPKAAAAALKWAVEEMENRYHKLAAAGVRNLAQFNEKAAAHGDDGLKLPYIIIIIDELADLMMVAANEVQDYIVRITQKARAAGIHLLVATQRPSVDVITGTIKNNIPTRIAFMVSSQIDSRTIIDQSGAERLLGRGDMLYLGNGQSQPIRIQGTYAENEIDKVVAFVKKQLPAHYLFEPEGLLEKVEETENQDDLFPKVLAYIAAEKQVSTSKLQRVFSIGYNRAANLIDTLEQRQLVSPASGSKPRDVYFTKDDLAQYQKRRHEGN